MAVSTKHSGFRKDVTNGTLDILVDGTEAVTLNNTAPYITIPSGLTVTADGLTVTAGGATITAGGATVTDGGLAVRGSARIREALTLTDVTTAGAGTYTAAALVGGLITRDPAGAARTDTTATGTEIETELNAQGIAVATDDCFTCYLVNTADAAEAITLAGGVGVTIANVAQTLAQSESALLLFKRTAANTFTLYILGA